MSPATLCRVLVNASHLPSGLTATSLSSPSSTSVCCWYPALPAGLNAPLGAPFISPNTLTVDTAASLAGSLAHFGSVAASTASGPDGAAAAGVSSLCTGCSVNTGPALCVGDFADAVAVCDT